MNEYTYIYDYTPVDSVLCLMTRAQLNSLGWWRGVAVTRFIRSTKLLFLYICEGSQGQSSYICNGPG